MSHAVLRRSSACPTPWSRRSAQRGIDEPFPIQEPRPSRRARRPRPARPLPHGLGQVARLRRADGRPDRGHRRRAGGARARPDARAGHPDRRGAPRRRPRPRAERSPPSTAAPASTSRPARAAKAHILVATPGPARGPAPAPRHHARARQACSSSTRPTACSTWASSPPSSGSSSRCRATARRCCSRPRSTPTSRSSPSSYTQRRRAATSTPRRRTRPRRRSSTASSPSTTTGKLNALVDELRDGDRGRTLVFVRTKRGADRLVKRLEAHGRPRRRDARRQDAGPAREGARHASRPATSTR